MLLIILLVAAGIGATITLILRWRYLTRTRRWFDAADAVVPGLFVALIGTVLAFLAPVLALSALPVTDTYVEKIDLRALGQDSGVSGWFFIGIGRVEDKNYVNWIQRDEDGANTIQREEDKYAKIYEDATPETAHISKKFEVKNYSGLLPWPFAYELDSSYTSFHIPPGSINDNYRVSVTPEEK